MLTEIKHLVVHKSFRKIGMGAALIKRAMARADTPLMFATIREKNTASISLFQQAGFRIVSTAEMKDHKTHFLLKENETYLKDQVTSEKPRVGVAFPSVPFGSGG
jgi:ribosomal protein S18 acetylase RimI-like enzyme